MDQVENYVAVLGLGQQVRGLLLDVGQSLLLHLEVAVVVTTVTKLERFSREESSQRAPLSFFVDGGSIN